MHRNRAIWTPPDPRPDDTAGHAHRRRNPTLQLRHLRYFVSIVDAGSFSRAAAVIHVAQPALSQQISELEERLGVPLLQRHARGVRPTEAGQVLYREAAAILRQIEQLPGLVRSTGGEPEGPVALGMSSTLAATLGGPLLQTCRAALPKVLLQLRLADSEMLKTQIGARAIDLALVFEDEPTPGFARCALFRQRLFYVASQAPAGRAGGALSIEALAALPLVMPTAPNVTRTVLEHAFARAGMKPLAVSEGNQLASIMSAVRMGLGGTVLPKGEGWDDSGPGAAAVFLPLEPPLALTASLLWSRDAALSRAAEAVRGEIAAFLDGYAVESASPGLEPIRP